MAAAGCSLDISRVRSNEPLDQETYRKLEVKRTTMDEVLRDLGAPDQLESKSGLDYLWYLHRDTMRLGVRFQSPFSLFGYRPTVAEIDINDLDTNAMRLVFDTGQYVLQDKSLRLAPAFARPDPTPQEWGLEIIPRYGFSPLLLGDAGEKSYSDLFSSGQLFGGYLAAFPVPYFMLLAGGNFQEYEGDSFTSRGLRVTMEDLHLYQFEVGGRFELPTEFFEGLADFDKLKKLFYTNDLSHHQGFMVYFQWTLGGTYNEEVFARVQGAPSGSYFKKSFGFSNAVGFGVEYLWERLGVTGGFEYQSIDAFKDGNAPLDTDADGFGNIVLTAGLIWRLR